MNDQLQVDQLRYRCSLCNELHSGLPELIAGLPDPIACVPSHERDARCWITSDLCSLDEEHFFVRCILEMPIVETGTCYGIGLWSSLSAANFKIYGDDFHGPRTGKCGPFFGWLSNGVPTFENPFVQKCCVHPRPGNLRPTIQLESTDHPLAVAQRNGVTLDHAMSMARLIPGVVFVVPEDPSGGFRS